MYLSLKLLETFQQYNKIALILKHACSIGFLWTCGSSVNWEYWGSLVNSFERLTLLKQSPQSI